MSKHLLFVSKKPLLMSSNQHLNQLKKKYNIKKLGFSGTLDPFAHGVMIIASGAYTKLFRFLKKTPKVYKATLFLGASSASFDSENITAIKPVQILDQQKVENAIKALVDITAQVPPKFSALKINGQRAYKLARKQFDFELDLRPCKIFDSCLLHYKHPFISFQVTVSEGTYIRSLAQDLATSLEVSATLSSLERLSEGSFNYEDEKFLDPLEFLDLEENIYLNSTEDFKLGKKLQRQAFKIQLLGTYFIKFQNYFSIIEIGYDKVHYIANQVPMFSSDI